MTQPAVSQQIAALEREVGVPLIERTTRSMRLTDAGLRLVEHADVILADCEKALAEIRAASSEVSGVVRMSVFRTAADSIALAAIVDLRRDYPQLDVITRDMPCDAAMLALKAGTLDIALAFEWDIVPIPEDSGIDRYPLFKEPVMVVLPSGHPLAEGTVRLRDMRGERWCLTQDTGYGREAFDQITESIDLQMRVVFESDNFRAIGSAVEAGLGVGLVPALTDMRGLDVTLQPLEEPRLTRTVFAAVRKGSGSTPAIQAVLDALAMPSCTLHRKSSAGA